jgi:carbamate kinase
MKIKEIRQQGHQALIEALGIANSLRFLQQVGAGYGDYTQERHQWLEQLNLEDFADYVEQKGRSNSQEE